MKSLFRIRRVVFGLVLGLLLACGGPVDTAKPAGEEAKGPHGGRLLKSGDFALELSIFERGVPPEFRAWATNAGRAVAADEVQMTVTLTRLGGVVNEILFSASDGFLRGDTVVYEPHSFEVSIEATHAGETHQWRFESFEGRTRIAPDVAQALGIDTDIAGRAVLPDVVELYGRIRPNRERVREVRARFDGVVRTVHAEIGSRVAKGDKLLTIESDESLNRYSVFAPIGGVISQRDVNPGEQTSGRLLMTITDAASVWAELAVFPTDRKRVRVGSTVEVTPSGGNGASTGTISAIDVVAQPDQSVVARAVLDNSDGALVPGVFASAKVTVAEYEVPLAVRREAIQEFRDFTVVFAQIGDEYEVRMLDLGRRSGDWVEVLGGLEPGTRYVTANSFLIKADIEKSGASHDH